jgi:hypothetical protein
MAIRLEDEKAGFRRDGLRSQVIDALEAQEINETGNEENALLGPSHSRSGVRYGHNIPATGL